MDGVGSRSAVFRQQHNTNLIQAIALMIVEHPATTVK